MNKENQHCSYRAIIEKIEQLNRDLRDVKDKLLHLKDQLIDNKEKNCHTNPEGANLQNTESLPPHPPTPQQQGES